MSKTLKDFSRAQIYKICDEYVHSPNHISAWYFCKTYGCKEGVFYGILQKGVKEHIIPDDMIPLLMQKSSENAYNHGDEGGQHLSQRNYEWCIEKRRTFQFNNKETKFYAEDYAKSPLSAADYACVNYMPVNLLQKTLQRAIVDNLVKKDIVFAMRVKALKFHPKENVDLYFDDLWKKRERNLYLKKSQKK